MPQFDIGAIHKGRQSLDFLIPSPSWPTYDAIVTKKVALLCPLWPELGRPFWMPPNGSDLIFAILSFFDGENQI